MFGLEKIRRLLLRCLVHWIIEPRGRGRRLTSKGEKRLKAFRLRLESLFCAAEEIFQKVDVCSSCREICCSGGFDRFTVIDSISNQAASAPPAEWGYLLFPLRSYERNRVDEGWCKYFCDGIGCTIQYKQRPSVCVWYICQRMRDRLSDGDLRELERIRRDLDSTHLRMAVIMVCGRGMWTS